MLLIGQTGAYVYISVYALKPNERRRFDERFFFSGREDSMGPLREGELLFISFFFFFFRGDRPKKWPQVFASVPSVCLFFAAIYISNLNISCSGNGLPTYLRIQNEQKDLRSTYWRYAIAPMPTGPYLEAYSLTPTNLLLQKWSIRMWYERATVVFPRRNFISVLITCTDRTQFSLFWYFSRRVGSLYVASTHILRLLEMRMLLGNVRSAFHRP